ncbi:MAG: hypothetical protein QOI47_2550 [Actinomycetota bacterium]|nr:hypothetical protein [Actinomycetota bacterium]
MDAFDADVLIYAAADDHPLGRRVRSLFRDVANEQGDAGVGSVLLLPELLSKPLRDGETRQLNALNDLLSRLDLRPADEATAALAASLAASYGLRAIDAVHLATGVAAGADRFITNNRSHFRKTIVEIDVTYPADLPER